MGGLAKRSTQHSVKYFSKTLLSCEMENYHSWCARLIVWHVIPGCMYNQALADVWATGAGIKCLYSTYLRLFLEAPPPIRNPRFYARCILLWQVDHCPHMPGNNFLNSRTESVHISGMPGREWPEMRCPFYTHLRCQTGAASRQTSSGVKNIQVCREIRRRLFPKRRWDRCARWTQKWKIGSGCTPQRPRLRV